MCLAATRLSGPFSFFVLTVVCVGLTSSDIGYTRDEGYYFKAGRDYFGWFQSLWHNWLSGNFLKPFEKATIDRHWSYNHEHPVLVKSLFALSYGVLKVNLGLFATDGSAMRFVGWCFGGLTVVMTYLLSLKLVPHLLRTFGITSLAVNASILLAHAFGVF